MKKKYVVQELVAFPMYYHALNYNSYSGNLVATGSIPGKETNYINVWTNKTLIHTQCYERKSPCNEGTCIAVSCDGKRMLVASVTRGVDLSIYNGINFSYIKTISLLKPPYRKTSWGVVVNSLIISQPVFSPHKDQETLVMIPCSDGYLRLCDVETGQTYEYIGFRKADTITFFSFFTSNDIQSKTDKISDNKIKYCWIIGGPDRLEYRSPESNDSKMFFFKDDMLWKHVWLEKHNKVFSISAIGQKEKRGKIIIQSGTLSGTFEEYFQKINGSVTTLRYSDRDDLVAIGLRSGSILLWNVKTHSLFCKIPSGGDAIRSMEFSPYESSLTVLYANNRMMNYNY